MGPPFDGWRSVTTTLETGLICVYRGRGGGAGRGRSLIFAGGTIQKKDSSPDLRSPKVGISLRKMMAG